MKPPVITLVVYYGEEEWDGACQLSDMLSISNDDVAKMVSNYKMNLFQVKNSGDYKFSHGDLQIPLKTVEKIIQEFK